MIEHKYHEDPEDSDHLLLIQLEESLLTRTDNCKHLYRPSDQPQPQPVKQKKFQNPSKLQHDFDEITITKEDARKALEMYASVISGGKVQITDPIFPYRLVQIQGGLLLLRRRRPSKCPICNRTHEKENPFLFVVGAEKAVYFHCRRAAPSQKMYIGKLCPGTDTQKVDPRVDEWLSKILNVPCEIPKNHLQELARSPVGVPQVKRRALRIAPPSHQRAVTDEMLPNYSWW